MSLGPLPEHVDARRLFAQNAKIHARVALASVPRLREYLVEGEGGQIEVQLDFSQDEGRQRRLSGTIQASLKIRCERCLQAMELPLQLTPDLLIASDEQERQALEALAGGEVLVCEGEQLALQALIEDELILGLPLVASHDDSNCNEKLNQLQERASTLTQAAQSNAGAFAELQKLKGRLTDRLKKDTNTDT